MIGLYIISYRSIFRRVFITACLGMTFDVFVASQPTNDMINADNTELWKYVNTYVMQNHKKFKECLKNISKQGYSIEGHLCCSCCNKKNLAKVRFQTGNKRFTLYNYVMSKFTYTDNQLKFKTHTVPKTQSEGNEQSNINIDEYVDIDELNYFFLPPLPEQKSADILPPPEQKNSDISNNCFSLPPPEEKT